MLIPPHQEGGTNSALRRGAASGTGCRRFNIMRSSGWARLRIARRARPACRGRGFRAGAAPRRARAAFTSLSPASSSFERFLPPLEVGARLQAVVPDLEVVAEIAARAPQASSGNMKSREAHGSPEAEIIARAGLSPIPDSIPPAVKPPLPARFSTARPA